MSSEKSDILAAFPAILKKLRMARGESTVALGKVVGRKRSAVERWETGARRPKVVEFFKIAQHYGVSVYALIGHAPPPKHVELAEKSRFNRICKNARRVVAANEVFTEALRGLISNIDEYSAGAVGTHGESDGHSRKKRQTTKRKKKAKKGG